jgi:hypothetical protein
MVALALATVLLADGRLATWGLPPPRWSAVLRWFTGLAATAMNTWTSLWPSERADRPHHADPAGVLLHTVPPLLLILLTETVAAYRKLLTGYGPGYGTGQPTPAPEPAPAPHPATAPPDPDPAGATAPPPHPEPAPDAPAGPSPIPAALFRHALTLDLHHLTTTGRPLSIRALKDRLHLGQDRARDLRTALDAHHARTRPPHPDAPGTAPLPHPPGAGPHPKR